MRARWWAVVVAVLNTLDTAPPGPGTLITDLRFTGDTLSWSHDGALRSAGLS